MVSNDQRAVFFFDIDNCVCLDSERLANEILLTWSSYTLEVRRLEVRALITIAQGHTDSKILEIMSDLIDKYFVTHLSLTETEARDLHQKYYKEYGLAIDGLVRHHKVDALEFNSKVDDAVPLDDILKPDAELRELLQDLDTSKVKPWLFTNAYINHGKRVVRLLGVEDLFEGITYCDYAQERLLAKPHREMFEKAMREAGISSKEDCYFVDDSFINVKGATDLGWKAVHFVEPDMKAPERLAGKYQISDLKELRRLFPDLFRSTTR